MLSLGRMCARSWFGLLSVQSCGLVSYWTFSGLLPATNTRSQQTRFPEAANFCSKAGGLQLFSLSQTPSIKVQFALGAAEMAHDDTLLSLQETLNLVKLPRRGEVRRFMSTRGAYLPGSDFPAGREMPMFHKASYGGHVYGQSALAAYRVWRELEDERGAKQQERLDLHAIHGFFTRAGIPDRPFIYDVTPLTSSRTFSTLSVTARQPSKPSTRVNPLGNERFPLADAALPLSPPAFTAICSLKLPEPDSAGVSTQESPPQTRFAAILSQRAPHAWPPAPPVDLTGVVALVGADQPGRFPIAEMRKVDMSAYNTGRDVHERRELVLYRLRLRRSSPDTTGSSSSSEEGWEWDANAHVAAHAYIADRNGLLMVANHIGFGFTLTRAASLSYSFVMHVGAEQAVMRHHDDGSDSDGWWIQEAWFPRSGAGRGIVESKIWSPAGVHVASEYQDGLVQGLADTGGQGMVMGMGMGLGRGLKL